jgi:hypothetical protein
MVSILRSQRSAQLGTRFLNGCGSLGGRDSGLWQIEGTSGPDIVAMSGDGSGERVAVQQCNSILPSVRGVQPFFRFSAAG